MKKSLKSVLSLLLAISMLVCFAACGDKNEAPAETTTAVVEEPEETVAADATEATEPVSTDETSATGLEESSAELTAEESSAASDESTTAAVTAAPTAKADIINLYNTSVTSAFNAKVGFYKERVTDNEKLNAGVAFKAFKSLVYKFMGIGADNKYTETVVKGKWDTDAKRNYLRKSTISDGDVTSATCKQSGKNYVIVLNVKNGSSKGSKAKSFTNAPIDKCGICVGNEDKGYYDHKTGAVIFDAIDDTFEKAVVDESYSGAKVTATVDAATGHLVSLTVEYNISTTIATNSVGTATATGTTHIKYSNFKY